MLMDEEAYASRAEVRLAKKQYREALADASKSIELDGNDGRAYYFRAEIQRAMGHKTEADSDFKKAASLGYRQPGADAGFGIVPNR